MATTIPQPPEAKPTKLDGWSAARLILCTIGGMLVGHGTGDEAIASQGEIEAVVGAILSLASICWGVYVRWNSRSVPLDVAVAENIPTKSSATGQITTGRGAPLT